MNPPTPTRRDESHRFGGPSEGTKDLKSAAFTLVELLIVLAVLALWALLLVPALARTQPDSRAARCLNNHRQLCRAWLMYADDNNDKLAINIHGGSAASPSQPLWAPGWLDWSTASDNTNTIYLTDARYSILATYCGKDARLFKCPADQYVSLSQRARGWRERVRSVSQNLYAATGNVDTGPTDPSYLHVTKLAELVNPKPSETWVSLDEHPDSINDEGFFAPYAAYWIDLPANYHDGGAGFAFADGHSEIHRWQASLLKVPVKYTFSAPAVTASDPDLLWLRYRTPRRPGVN